MESDGKENVNVRVHQGALRESAELISLYERGRKHELEQAEKRRHEESSLEKSDIIQKENENQFTVLKDLNTYEVPLEKTSKNNDDTNPFIDAERERSNDVVNNLNLKLKLRSPPKKSHLSTPSTGRTIMINTSISNTASVRTNLTNITPSDDTDVPIEILEEMNKIQETFQGLDQKYRLIDKIGEGTFSTVYKAEALMDDANYLIGEKIYSSPEIKRRKKAKTKPKIYVALKRIYVTSSPQRIFNELNLLYMLSGSKRVAPLLEALRFQDQIIAVLPYYHHADFREFFRDLPIQGIKHYMYELFQSLKFVHSKRIIHRDIKPTNFLYDPFTKRGVLVDFGLAEQESISIVYDKAQAGYCPCIHPSNKIITKHEDPLKGYPKNDDRPGRRANRAGTRGFRAPEVLFKCPYQRVDIDVWSAGVILLTLLSRRFPFFNSRDDTDALVELTSIFGLKELQEAALIHGLGLDTNLMTLTNVKKHSLGGLIHSAIKVEDEKNTLPKDSVAYDTLKAMNERGEIKHKPQDDHEIYILKKAHIEAFEVMSHCFKLNPEERSSANQILKLPFFDDFNQGFKADPESKPEEYIFTKNIAEDDEIFLIGQAH
ncbi:hypothetical protein WICMUC_001585 [Wickerhamomyces mucosus]|uniref:non-specific serine/threonine protein kinase n=1 Tax=Wickerhamomyces mucosus TaxID=1378264 RepID=A0A9P8TGV2_9ASCO|nr:hypothetical protein WICMUC_001585 [Wickerhamomyces mucosus]